MAADILSELFSDTRVKVMRLFLHNPQAAMDIEEAAERLALEPKPVHAEVRMLARIGFLQTAGKTGKKEAKTHSGAAKASARWILNSDFELLRPLKTLLMTEAPLSNAALLKRFDAAFGNRLKLIVLAGVFLDQDSARADILLVGDGVHRTRLERVVKTLEADFGRAVNYVYFTSEEYDYRMKMSDRFLRDILATPHETLANRLESKKA
ncbi:MAG: hypothetical protein HYS44_03175 [Candidatus Niyogibacteria bacterium]|nr:hypothetical protein [Candidatus Niyogibacteria bacterium]